MQRKASTGYLPQANDAFVIYRFVRIFILGHKYQTDPSPFGRGGSVTILGVALMHLFQAIIITAWPTATKTTALLALLRVLHLEDRAYGYLILALCMMLVSIASVSGIVFRLGYIRLIVFMPQQFFLTIMAGGGIAAMSVGRYLDGTVVPWQHIATDQVAYTVLAFIHASAILRRFWHPDA